MRRQGSGSTLSAILITFGIILFSGFVLQALEPKCGAAGCNERVVSGNKYCTIHQISYRTYGTPDYHSVYRRSQENRNRSTYTNLNANSNVSSSGSDTGKSSNASSSFSGKRYDPYDVDEYDNPDDFAEEWAEEFGEGDYEEGYDEAYDYWESERE